MTLVGCPDCGGPVALPGGAETGDLVECPRCAGLALRVREVAGVWSAAAAHRVSCPACEAHVWLPAEARPGDPIEHCGRRFRLTWGFGAFAAEPDAAAP